jgi:hypothetical protein
MEIDEPGRKIVDKMKITLLHILIVAKHHAAGRLVQGKRTTVRQKFGCAYSDSHP